MMIMRLISLSLPLFALLLAGCGTSTSINGSWSAPGAEVGNYQKVAVVAIGTQTQNTRIAETEITASLNARGIPAVPGYDIFQEGYLKGQPSKEDIQSKLRQANVEGLLTVALLDAKEETYYVPGTTRYAPYPTYPYYGSWYGYYNFYAPTVYEPGYYAQSTNFFLETNLYDVDDAELVWSAQSSTIDPTSFSSFAKSYSGSIVKQMQKDGVIRK